MCIILDPWGLWRENIACKKTLNKFDSVNIFRYLFSSLSQWQAAVFLTLCEKREVSTQIQKTYLCHFTLVYKNLLSLRLFISLTQYKGAKVEISSTYSTSDSCAGNEFTACWKPVAVFHMEHAQCQCGQIFNMGGGVLNLYYISWAALWQTNSSWLSGSPKRGRDSIARVLHFNSLSALPGLYSALI